MGHLVGRRRLGIAEAAVPWRFWYVLGISVDLEPVWFSQDDLFNSKVLERGRAGVQCLWQRCLLYLFIFLETLGNTCHRGHGILERGLVQPRYPICDFTVAEIQKWCPGHPAWLGGIDLEGTFVSHDSLPEQLILGCRDLLLSAVFILIVGNGPVFDLVLRIQGRQKIHRRRISGRWIRWWRPSDGRTGTCGLSSVVQSSGPSHRCPGPSHWHLGSSVWRPRWSLGPPGWGFIISGCRNGWLCSAPGLGIRNSHTWVHPTLHQSPHGHEINQSSLVDRSWQWREQKTADIRQHGWVLSCSWRVTCWSTKGHRTIHNCWAIHCRVLMVCWAGHTYQVVIIKCWAISCWLLTCWVGNFLWLIHNVRLVIHDHDGSPCWPVTCWPVICWAIICWAVTCRVVICWAVTCWAVHRLCRTRHSCWVAHFSCRFLNVFWLGRRRNHHDGSSLWWLSNGWGQLYLPSGDVWWTRPLSTFMSSILMMTRWRLAICWCPWWWWRQGPTITGWLVMMVMGMRGRPWRPDIRRPRRDTAQPRTTRGISLPPGAGPTRWRGPGPLPLSTSTVVSGRMMGPWGVLESVGPVRSSIALPTSWSVAFRPLGPGTTVRPGPSHHRHAGSHGLLGLTGPGRPASRLLHLRSLWLRTCGCLGSLCLGRPVALTLHRKLKDLFRSVYLNRVLHCVSLLGLLCHFRNCSRLTSALLFVGFLLSLPGLRQPILKDLTGRIFSTQSEALV